MAVVLVSHLTVESLKHVPVRTLKESPAGDRAGLPSAGGVAGERAGLPSAGRVAGERAGPYSDGEVDLACLPSNGGLFGGRAGPPLTVESLEDVPVRPRKEAPLETVMVYPLKEEPVVLGCPLTVASLVNARVSTQPEVPQRNVLACPQTEPLLEKVLVASQRERSRWRTSLLRRCPGISGGPWWRRSPWRACCCLLFALTLFSYTGI